MISKSAFTRNLLKSNSEFHFSAQYTAKEYPHSSNRLSLFFTSQSDALHNLIKMHDVTDS